MSKNKNRRPQSSKPAKSANRDYMYAMQGLRGSSAAFPHANKSRYSRTVKHKNKGWD